MPRKTASLILVLAIALVGTSATAAAAGQRRYDGATTQDIPISFLLRREAAEPFRLKALAFGGDMLCALDDTHQEWNVHMSFGRGPTLDGRRLTFDDVSAEWAVHITGVFRAQTADGTFRFSVPSLTAEEEAQVCTTGDLTWSANRRAVANDRPSGPADRVIRRPGGTTVRIWRTG